MKVKVSFSEIDPPMRIDADFECTKVPVDGPHQKILFINKTKGLGYNRVKYLYYENLKIEKHPYFTSFRDDSVEWVLCWK